MERNGPLGPFLLQKKAPAGNRRIPPFSVLPRSALWQVCGKNLTHDRLIEKGH
jgi:hypothetical protein